MEFKEFNALLQKHILSMAQGETHLFEVVLDKDELWQTYLESFPSERKQVFRKRREFDCSCCRSFVRSFGNVVAIKNNRMVTIWDFDTHSPVYQPVVDALAAFVRSKPITEVFVTNARSFGTAVSYEKTDDVESLIEAIKHLRNVLSASKHVTNCDSHMAQERARHELGQKMWNVLYPK